MYFTSFEFLFNFFYFFFLFPLFMNSISIINFQMAFSGLSCVSFQYNIKIYPQKCDIAIIVKWKKFMMLEMRKKKLLFRLMVDSNGNLSQRKYNFRPLEFIFSTFSLHLLQAYNICFLIL